MKYCSKCRTQMSDHILICPQCQSPTNDQHSQILNQKPSKNTSNKINPLISANFILSALTLIAVIILYFIPLSINGTTSNDVDNPNEITSNFVNSTCPADEYMNHDWAPAKCTEPAQCYNCNAYRDNTLGHHSFYTHDDGICDCSYCGILYEIYIESLD